MIASSLLIVGDSHVNVFGIPLQWVEGEYRLHQIESAPLPILGLVGEWPHELLGYWARAIEEAPGRVVAILWAGNQHFQNFLLSHEDPFDFLLDEKPDLPVDASLQLVPEAAVRAFVEDTTTPLGSFIEAIRTAGGIPVICGTPPPKNDDDMIRSLVMREGYFQRFAEELGLDLATVEISSAVFRYKVWMVIQDTYRNLAERHGAMFIPIPAQAQTENGFLHPDYDLGDATHANALYGRLMLTEITRAITGYLKT